MIVVQPGSANRTPFSLAGNASEQFQFTVPPGTANNGSFNISTSGNDKIANWNATDSAGNALPGLTSGGIVPGLVFVYFTSNNTMPGFYPTLVPGDYLVNVTASDGGYSGIAESIPPQVPGGGGHGRR